MTITDQADASCIVNAAVLSHAEQWEAITNSEEILMEYKKPFDEEDQKENHVSWANNWNFGKGRMVIEKGVIANATDVQKSLSMMEVEFKKPNEKKKDYVNEFLSNQFLVYNIGRKIAEVFADILEWDVRFHTFINKIEYQAFTFGYCPVIRDKFNYLGNPIAIKRIAFEDRTTLEQIRNYVVFDSIKAEQLLERIKICEEFKTELVQPCRGEDYHIYETGWIKEGIEEIFYNLLSNNPDVVSDVRDGKLKLNAILHENEIKITTWEDVSAIREHKGDTWLTVNLNNINIAKIFTTDSNGEITETYIVVTDYIYNEGYTTSVSTNQYLLYQKNLGNKPYTDYINIIKEFGIGSDDYIQNLKGVSRQVVQDSLFYDFKRNAIEDKLLLTGNLVVNETEDLACSIAESEDCNVRFDS